MKGLSIIIRNEKEFNSVKSFLGEENLYLGFVPQMAERETAIVIYAKKKTDLSTGSVGCAERQRSLGIKTVEFSKYFK